jgi:hypothetical protein
VSRVQEPEPDEVRRLAEAIAEKAHDAEGGVYHDLFEAWRGFTEECLNAAGIELADEGEYQVAAKWMWRSAFMGGNYTQDARRVLRAARGGDVEL